MNKLTTILAAVMFLFFSLAGYAQSNEKLAGAQDLLNKYLVASTFEENGQFLVNENTKKSFTDLFKKNAAIIFDVPLANEASAKNNLKRYSESERQQSSVIPVFGKQLSPGTYVSILDRELIKDKQIAVHARPTGRKDLSAFDTTGVVVFEIEKSFAEMDSLATLPAKYLVEIDASGSRPIITGIRRNEEEILKRNMVIQLLNDSRPVTSKDTMTCLVTIEYPESINNTTDTLKSIDGKIRLEQVANRATIKLKTANDLEAVEYEIPTDWKTKGKKVSEQPEDGFEANLLPRTWNGLAYTVDVHGGIFEQSENNTANFENNSNFINDPGYRFAGEFLVTKYFNPKKWKQSGWLFGIGIGVTISYQSVVTKSDNFIQNKYKYEDTSGDTCEVQFSGDGFKETTTRIDIAVPVYLDFKTRLSRKASMTIQPGVNVIFPFQIDHKAAGNFSRWGYYEQFNELPYTDDPVYNYFTDQARTYTDDGVYSLQMEGQLRVNFLLHVFNKHPDNALVIGLIGALPLINPTTYTYGQGIVQDYQGYWISTENEDYHSLVHSKARSYEFFVGLSVGINLVRYKTK